MPTTCTISSKSRGKASLAVPSVGRGGNGAAEWRDLRGPVSQICEHSGSVFLGKPRIAFWRSRPSRSLVAIRLLHCGGSIPSPTSPMRDAALVGRTRGDVSYNAKSTLAKGSVEGKGATQTVATPETSTSSKMSGVRMRPELNVPQVSAAPGMVRRSNSPG